MRESAPTSLVTVVCPLQLERRLLRKALATTPARVRVVQGGFGAEAMTRWMNAHAPALADHHLILCGLAGALRVDRPAGTAYVITRVHDRNAQSWSPPGAGGQVEPCRVTSVLVPITTPAGKQRLARDSGADLVDLESVAFAIAAEHHGLRWSIVRGVSDGVDDILHRAMGMWINPSTGATRVGRVGVDLVRHPSLIRTVHRLGRHAGQAMAAAAGLICRIDDSASERGIG